MDRFKEQIQELTGVDCGFFFFSSRRRHTRCGRDWSSDVCSSDLWSPFACIPDFQQVGELVYQPPHLRRVRPDHGVVEPTEAEPAQDDPMGPWRADGTDRKSVV